MIFTADEEFRSPDGENTIWRPSQNVIYELGAASILYGKRIIIFEEDGLDFPSDFRDIGYISFEKDRLDAKTMDLFKELIGMGLATFQPT
jgi:predicted nucleotide-binding protein